MLLLEMLILVATLSSQEFSNGHADSVVKFQYYIRPPCRGSCRKPLPLAIPAPASVDPERLLVAAALSPHMLTAS